MSEMKAIRNFDDLSVALGREAALRHIPLNGTIEITHRCPLTCAHCYNNLPIGDRQAQAEELTYGEHCKIIDDIVQAGCLWLLYTGGEIFARPDFLDIYTYARKKGLLITLFTNATMITPEIADHLVSYRPYAIEVTLYGHTRETYERLTGVAGSFDRCIRGIELLLERKLPLKLKSVVVSINQHEIWAMKKYAEEDLGLEFKFDSMMNPRIDCSASPLAVRLTPEEVVSLDLQDPKRVEAFHGMASRYMTPQPISPRDELYSCGGGIHSWAISPTGKMSICVLSKMDMYDLRGGTFTEGWEKFLHAARGKKVTRPTKCVRCQLKSICGMCPAAAELENRDPEEPVDFLCEVAHLRAHTLGWKVAEHGPCEYCDGGSRHAHVVASGAKLSAGVTRSRHLPVFVDAAAMSEEGDGCGSGHCTSCS